jgi:diaminopimelate epimerase
VTKGHATENDFVIIEDLGGDFELTPALVRALCDRHAGIGADGVLRVVRSANDPAAAAMAGAAPYFMDYRNADGSIAEMCGNGVRLFLRYLQSSGLVERETSVATRGGVRRVWSEFAGSTESAGSAAITVEMGRPQLLDARPDVRAGAGAKPRSGVAVLVPNPHVVVTLDAVTDLAELDLATPPLVDPSLPDGQNVEFVAWAGPQHLVMRVHERGVGETRSCGTGICAAVAAVAVSMPEWDGPDGTTWQVDVPGGTCFVRWTTSGELLLTGPAEIVGEVELSAEWLAVLTRESG